MPMHEELAPGKPGFPVHYSRVDSNLVPTTVDCSLADMLIRVPVLAVPDDAVLAALTLDERPIDVRVHDRPATRRAVKARDPPLETGHVDDHPPLKPCK